MIPCTVGILTHNSGKTLARTLESVRDFADVVVLDGNSTDDTRDIAKRFGARVEAQDTQFINGEGRIVDFSGVRNQQLSLARFPWFLFVDSDEYLSNEVVSEVAQVVSEGVAAKEKVFRMPRKYVVDGTIIERSAMYPNYQTRFFFIPAVEGFVKPVHEKLRIRAGEQLGTLRHPTYVPFESEEEILTKWKRYAEQQIAHHPVSLRTILPYTWHNVVQVVKYCVKIFLSRFGTGALLPIRYEWHNVLYHLRLITLSWRKLIRA